MSAMSSRTRLGLSLICAALVLGLLGDLLFRATPLGLNVALWTACFVAALLALARFGGLPLRREHRLMLVPLLVFSALVAWRDSPWLLALNLFAMLVAVTIGAMQSPARGLHRAGLVDYVVGLGTVGAATGNRALALMQHDIGWQELRPTAGRQALAVGRGVALALPLLFLFGALFVAADRVFKGFVTGALPDLGDAAGHTLLFAVFAWVSAGLLRELLAKGEPVELQVRRFFTLGATELAVVIGLLDLLFLAFVLVQVRYLFGGESLVEERAQLTYAEYARHGFFELVAVAALVLPLILIADWALRRERPGHQRLFRTLAAVLLVLLSVVMASALERMRLYQREYGLTELRFYVTAFMIWLAVVFVWLAATVLRSRRDLFAVGALVSGFAAILVLNALNPDAVIARTNLDRPNLDVPYLLRLSDDATPALVEAMPKLDPDVRRQLEVELGSRNREPGDWRTWNWGRWQARRDLSSFPP
jgi:hypothetical protein